MRERRCTPQQIARYRDKLSGPLRDRIDLTVEVPALTVAELTTAAHGEASTAARERFVTARERQRARYADDGIRTNTERTPALMARDCAIDATAARLLTTAIARMSLSARGDDRVRKVARTIDAEVPLHRRICRRIVWLEGLLECQGPGVRRTRRAWLALAAVIEFGVAACERSPSLSTATAASRLGRRSTVCGTVVNYSCSPPDWITVLSLDTPEGVSPFVVEISRSDRGAFGNRVEDRYFAHYLCATGQIVSHRSVVAIQATTPDQLRVAGGFSPAMSLAPENAYRACDDGIEAGAVIKAVQPAYPPTATNDRIAGQVELEGLIAPSGVVRHVRVLGSLDPELDIEAIRAFQQWRYNPATRYGVAVPLLTNVYMTFNLQGKVQTDGK